MATIYCKGKPTTPPVVGGVTFSLYDEAHGIWAGTATAPQVTALTGAGFPFLTDAELDRFQADLTAVSSAQSALAALEATATTDASAVGALRATHDSDVAALALDPANATLIANEAASSAALSAGQATAATAARAVLDQRVSLLSLHSAIPIVRNGKINPWL